MTAVMKPVISATVLAEFQNAMAADRQAGLGAAVEVGVVEYTNTDIRNAIDEYIHSERDRKILVRRLIDGRTYEQLAEEMDMSVRQVQNIVYKAQERLFKHLW